MLGERVGTETKVKLVKRTAGSPIETPLSEAQMRRVGMHSDQRDQEHQ